MDISQAPRGAAEPQGQVVQGGCQLPGDRGVGQGRAAGNPGPYGSIVCVLSFVGFSVLGVSLSGGFFGGASSSAFALCTFACPADCQLFSSSSSVGF